MAHCRRCLEQASFESHDSLVDRVGFKRRAKSASWAGRCRGRQEYNRDGVGDRRAADRCKCVAVALLLQR